MAALLRMPEVAASAAEAVLAGWPVADGTSFATGDVIATVETDKAVVDVLAESDGVMLRALVPAGSPVLVGAPIAVLGGAGEVVQDVDRLLVDLGVVAEPQPSPAAPGTGGSGDPATSATDVTPVTPASRPLAGRPGEQVGAGVRVFSSPLARRLAKEQGLALELIVGTGRGGRIVRRDVEAAATRAPHAPAQLAGTPGPDAAGPPANCAGA